MIRLISKTYTGSITIFARERFADVLNPGDIAVDATAGRGHDCVELAAAVGADGQVLGVDLQQDAVASARARVEALGLSQVRIVQGSHANWSEILPQQWMGRIKGVVYNLGYLPGGDHQIVTRPEATAASLRGIFSWLHPQGVIRIICYRGHPGGVDEYQRVMEVAQEVVSPEDVIESFFPESGTENAPVLLMIRRRERTVKTNGGGQPPPPG